ncbi:MAG TPA: FkbM family methyltransferase [Pirellulales bacterium]|jgi:FkbM family methyltransferase|nr:FkbM family methyltransferase [Pirellulales bacterium]
MSLRKRVKKLLYGYTPGFAGRFPYFGTQVYFPPKAEAFDAVCQTGIFEAENVHALVALARPDSFVFDVGANLGLMAIPVLAKCPSCTVVSFEPSPATLACLQRTARQSGYGDRWQIVGKAASAQSGQAEFFAGPPALGVYDGLRATGRSGQVRKMIVEVTTVDDEWDRLGQPVVSLIKVDVEGAEYEVLTGARRCIASRRPAILSEWATVNARNYDRPVEQFYDLVRELGYQMYAVPHMSRTESRKMLQAQLLFCSNFVLLPDD